MRCSSFFTFNFDFCLNTFIKNKKITPLQCDVIFAVLIEPDQRGLKEKKRG